VPRHLVLVAAVLALTGCGNLSRAELKRGVETLNAIAVEGRLLADGVAADRTKATYARVHARTLAEDAAHEAEKLADATPQPGTEAQRAQAVDLAGRLDDAIGELVTRPGDEQTGEEVRDTVASLADQLERVSARLEDVP
jgi:hypothetical protein